MHPCTKLTHEEYLHAVRNIGVARLNDPMSRDRLLAVKLVYGSGDPCVFGRCFYRAWDHSERRELVEVSAFGEESALQLAATVLHELAHCLAGWDAGHDATWKQAARALGLARPVAAGWDARADNLAADVRDALVLLGEPTDGRPNHPAPVRVERPCPLGVGTRGGTSRGPGSGSRLRLYACNCHPPVRLRVARDPEHFHVRCLDCASAFMPAQAGRVGRPPRDSRADQEVSQ